MFHINTHSSEPIFEQLVTQVTRYIALHLLAEDDQLPTVRNLAKELAINPSTVSKAYQICEKEGFIYSIPGKGFFVSRNNNAQQAVQKELYRQLESSYYKLREFGETHDGILKHIQSMEGEFHD